MFCPLPFSFAKTNCQCYCKSGIGIGIKTVIQDKLSQIISIQNTHKLARRARLIWYILASHVSVCACISRYLWFALKWQSNVQHFSVCVKETDHECCQMVIAGMDTPKYGETQVQADKRHLIPKWQPINYSFVCMLISPLCLIFTSKIFCFFIHDDEAMTCKQKNTLLAAILEKGVFRQRITAGSATDL